VGVEWSRTAEGGLRLDWQEAGGPPVGGAPGRQGFGSNLVQSLVAGQLGGTVERHWAGEGLRCRILLPAECLEADEDAPEQGVNAAARGPARA
jgi:two-component sensor histidine kinase